MIPIIATSVVMRTGIFSAGMGTGGSHLARSQLFRGPKPASFAQIGSKLSQQVRLPVANLRPAPIASKQFVNTAV